ncbi:Ubiquitin-conjugating enzyme [Macleaya cordata]|uniref:Ubiquitin-conjugating enzyme n=1 Tax=Macleaya cordata TaxID=56857 RepID=A0A200QPG7_MACCD|nr:Ubiquitin-conjugating enzyme [Macleaya cordata]
MDKHEEIICIRIEGGEEEAVENNQINIRRGEFKQFDIILTDDDDDDNNSIDDHHYYGSSNHRRISNNNQTSKRIMQEWKILEKSLPDSIYVRAYEGRIDLLRAVIIGASGTPYHDGLFFFDIQFPSDYPNKPPKVYYHSFGYRLNPNLYQGGLVCLSLINTWRGTEKENWNPSESTVLQILLSIQALVLNAEPYFNEAGHIFGELSTWKKGSLAYYNEDNKYLSTWKKESLAYNEETFVLSCRTMLAVLNKPPKHFEEFVGQYFRDRAETILIASKAYIDGKVKVGHHIQIENTASSSFSSTVSGESNKKFQDSMGIIYSKLLLAFIKNGSSLEYYVGDNMDDHLSNNQVVLPEPDPLFDQIVSVLVGVLYVLLIIFLLVIVPIIV